MLRRFDRWLGEFLHWTRYDVGAFGAVVAFFAGCAGFLLGRGAHP